MWSGGEYYTFYPAKRNIKLIVKKYWRTYFSAIRGPEDSLYNGGMYHGKLVFPSGTWSVQDLLKWVAIFPSEFPFKPPSIYMTTPNGRSESMNNSKYFYEPKSRALQVQNCHTSLFRFKPDTRLCLSISDYHPDAWNPAWSVSTILTGLTLDVIGDNAHCYGRKKPASLSAHASKILTMQVSWASCSREARP